MFSNPGSLSSISTSRSFNLLYTKRPQNPRIAHPHVQPRAFHIDRRHHLEEAWKRQKAEEELLSPTSIERSLAQNGTVISVKHLTHLTHLLEAAGGRLVIVYLYSRSCGVCKSVRGAVTAIAQEAKASRARILFLEADVFDEFDYPSDIARFYNIKSVPRFLFFSDGARVHEAVGMKDLRQLVRTHDEVQSAVVADQQRLKSLLWELLIKNAPSARR